MTSTGRGDAARQRKGRWVNGTRDRTRRHAVRRSQLKPGSKRVGEKGTAGRPATGSAEASHAGADMKAPLVMTYQRQCNRVAREVKMGGVPGPASAWTSDPGRFPGGCGGGRSQDRVLSTVQVVSQRRPLGHEVSNSPAGVS